MKYLTIFFILIMPLVASAETTNHVRLLLHGHHAVEESNFGIAGWVIAPSITDVPDKWIGITGPRYDGEGWSLEFMAGAVISGGEATSLIDLRIEFTPDFWGAPIYVWGNAQLVDLTFEEVGGYGYLQIDYVLPLGLGLIGLETENSYHSGPDDWSIAPQLVLPLSDHFVLVGAYQFHLDGSQQLWLRVVLNL